MYYLPCRGDYMAKDITITKKNNKRGEDGYKIVSVRMKDETIERLDNLTNSKRAGSTEPAQFFYLQKELPNRSVKVASVLLESCFLLN